MVRAMVSIFDRICKRQAKVQAPVEEVRCVYLDVHGGRRTCTAMGRSWPRCSVACALFEPDSPQRRGER